MEGKIVVNRSLIEQANLAAEYDLWKVVAGWGGGIAISLGIVVAVATAVAFFSNAKLQDLETQAVTFRRELDAETRKTPVSAWPARLLKEDLWTESIRTDGLTRWTRPRATAQGGAIPAPTEMLVKKGEETLAHVQAYPFGDTYVWPYGPVANHLKDGQRDIEIVDVVRRLGIADFIRTTSAPVVQVVGVGLESSHGGDPDDLTRELSWQRGILLADAAAQSILVVDPKRRIDFRALGLGRATKSAARETADERRQRSALIMTVAFMRYDAALLRLDESLWQAIVEVPLGALDLFDYEYAFDALERLTGPIAVGDDEGGGPLARPKLTAAEAMARRPKEHK